MRFLRRWNRYANSRQPVQRLLERYLDFIDPAKIAVESREFPQRVCLDAYSELQAWLENHCEVDQLVGVPEASGFMSELGMVQLLAPSHEPVYTSALEYETFDIGNDESQACVKSALWLFRAEDQMFALLWYIKTVSSGCGFQSKLRIELASHENKTAKKLSQELLNAIVKSVEQAKTYRGKVLSLNEENRYDGNATGLTVHNLREVSRDDIILPPNTLGLLERNVVRFIEQRERLRELGIPTKKGLLFYGPPGTGKTHTIHYLTRILPKHTTLLITAEQVAQLDEYMSLARLMQPSIVVLEDVDLIARQRSDLDVSQESMLNKLLNEMDGLREDADILFILTTNRAESLESALASRPGRIDQAIEFPLPDSKGRSKLVKLYASGLKLSDADISYTVSRTEGVSAAFIKELMRRALQFNLECRSTDANGEIKILQNDIDQAIDELLYAGGSLNRLLLGAEGSDNFE